MVKRQFTADAPNKKRLLRSSAPQVADFTYVHTKSGWVYTAFVIDVFKRVIVGWRVSNRMDTQFVFDALNQAILSPINSGRFSIFESFYFSAF